MGTFLRDRAIGTVLTPALLTGSFFYSRCALRADIRRKLDARPHENKQPVKAEGALVQPFLAMFKELFNWEPGEYIIEPCSSGCHTQPLDVVARDFAA